MILFAKLQATHDERTGSFDIVVTHLFANVIFKASVAVRSAAQSAYLTATGQRQSSVGVSRSNVFFNPLKAFSAMVRYRASIYPLFTALA